MKNADSIREENRIFNEKQQESGDLNVQKNFEVYHAANYVDPKLSESYCPNKIIEWKGSWTLPVFLPKKQIKAETHVQRQLRSNHSLT
nr:unnamed protein product [Callosobruchus chinensis]